MESTCSASSMTCSMLQPAGVILQQQVSHEAPGMPPLLPSVSREHACMGTRTKTCHTITGGDQPCLSLHRQAARDAGAVHTIHAAPGHWCGLTNIHPHITTTAHNTWQQETDTRATLGHAGS